MDSYQKHLELLQKAMGLAELEFDEHGRCALLLEQRLPFWINRNHALHAFDLVGMPGCTLPEPLPAMFTEHFLGMAWEALLGVCPVLGRNARSGEVTLHLNLPLARLEERSLVEYLGDFLGELLTLEKLLNRPFATEKNQEPAPLEQTV